MKMPSEIIIIYKDFTFALSHFHKMGVVQRSV